MDEHPHNDTDRAAIVHVHALALVRTPALVHAHVSLSVGSVPACATVLSPEGQAKKMDDKQTTASVFGLFILTLIHQGLCQRRE